MAPDTEPVQTADVLIVGSGVAGLAAALHAAGRSVTILSKTSFAGGGSSPYAQGGVAVALGLDDSPAQHARDTIAAGWGLCDDEVVRLVTEEGPARIRELIGLGARLDRDSNGGLAFGREGAHSRRRVVHAAGDATGAELTRALATTVRLLPNVEIVERVLALDLLLEGRRVAGVVAVDADGRRRLWSAADVVLATGGTGQVYRHTTNPAEGTGDGLAMAARAGARLAGLEFVQFHPTAMAVGGNPMPLLTEALRGEGAPLVDETGHRFMVDVHRLAELAPRDVVARAIWRHRRNGHQVFLDTTLLAGRFEDRFPTVLELCLDRGLDPREQAVPAAPAAHYHMGGVVTDHRGRASIAGLWACGEVSHTGLHGANRLASNSLLEALVFGARVGGALSASARRPSLRVGRAAAHPRVAELPWLAAGGEQARFADRLRDIMWEGVGLERTAAGMQRALWDLNQIDQTAPAGLGELRNLLTVAMLIARAAQARTESRGAHFRGDIPWQDPHWRQDLVFDGLEMMDPHPVAVAG